MNVDFSSAGLSRDVIAETYGRFALSCGVLLETGASQDHTKNLPAISLGTPISPGAARWLLVPHSRSRGAGRMVYKLLISAVTTAGRADFNMRLRRYTEGDSTTGGGTPYGSTISFSHTFSGTDSLAWVTQYEDLALYERDPTVLRVQLLGTSTCGGLLVHHVEAQFFGREN